MRAQSAVIVTLLAIRRGAVSTLRASRRARLGVQCVPALQQLVHDLRRRCIRVDAGAAHVLEQLVQPWSYTSSVPAARSPMRTWLRVTIVVTSPTP